MIAGLGPSSNVIPSFRAELVRHIVFPNSCARGCTAPYAVIPAAAAITVGAPISQGFMRPFSHERQWSCGEAGGFALMRRSPRSAKPS